MKNKRLTQLAAGVILLAISCPLFAHHSAARYDRNKRMTLKGTVTRWLLINPHAQVHFEVKDDKGNVEKWIAESGPPQRLYRAGWNPKSLKPGDQITVTGAPAIGAPQVLSILELVVEGGTAPTLTEGAE